LVEEVGYNGKPAIWYSLDSKGRKQKHVRNSLGVSITRDPGPDGSMFYEDGDDVAEGD